MAHPGARRAPDGMRVVEGGPGDEGRGASAWSYEEVISSLLEATHRLHPDAIMPVLAQAFARLGMRDLAVYLADPDQRVLVPLPGEAVRPRAVLAIDGTLGGRAFRTERPIEGSGAEDDPGAGAQETARRLWVPIVNGAERLGVLAVTVGAPDEVATRRACDLAAITGSLLARQEACGDLLLCSRRVRPMELAAELRWEVLRPLTYVDDRVAIAGILGPAYEIAGDSFDYAINGDVVDIVIIDAMGHGLEASRMANLAVGAYRHARRAGAGLPQMFGAMDREVAGAFGPEKFVTGQLGRLDTSSGHLRWINAGHPPPLLLRGRTIVAVDTVVSLPMGMGDVATASELALEPDDSVLFFTDGVTEARSPSGEQFGRSRLADLLVRATTAGETIAETIRMLSHAVLAHQEDCLQDDATLLLMVWLGAGTAPAG